MKKIIYTLLFISISYQFGFAQCIPHSYTGNHGWILPDSSQFPHAVKNQAFNTNIQIQVAHDTTGTFQVPVLGATAGTFVFDSITIHGVTTQPLLPNAIGIQYTCNPANCSFPGASNGCINVIVPSAGLTKVGTYRIIVTAVGKGTFTPTQLPIPSPQTITQVVDWYKIIVDSTGGTSLVENLNDFNFNEFNFLNLRPNPANDLASIEFYSPKSTLIKMYVMDMIGRNIFSDEWNTKNGINKNELNITGLANGIYLVSFNFEGRNFSKKLIVQH